MESNIPSVTEESKPVRNSRERRLRQWTLIGWARSAHGWLLEMGNFEDVESDGLMMILSEYKNWKKNNAYLLYRQTVTVNSCPLEVEIVDVSGESRDRGLPLEAAQWADACVLVYSITDRASFEWALLALTHFRRLRPAGTPTALLANKADLEHLRAVAESEGRQAALQAGCAFCEVSVAENSAALYAAS
ncbi:GTP-binding protein Rheb homolog [Gryllus bimaculatus]|nr:GTP-binding protein Rheb homolog [Gryllus bimaculatus]